MEYASKGVAGAALGTGIAGLSLGVLNSLGGLGSAVGMFGPRTAVVDADTVGRHYACSEDHHVNRYEAAQAARIAELETEVKLRDANTYTDQKILATYQYIDGKLEGNLKTKGDVIVAPKAEVIGNISAHNVLIAGTVTGDVTAKGQVSMMSKGKLKGDITYSAMAMEEDAEITGSCSLQTRPAKK